MRQYLAIVRNSLRKSGGKGTRASAATGLAMLCFGLVLLSSIVGLYYWWWATYYWHKHEPRRVVVVNAPQTWMDYVDESEPDYRFFYYDHPYVFDISQFNEWMEDDHAFLTVVFPTEDEDGERADVRTFYPINSLDNKDRRDKFVEKCLDGYQNYLLKTEGIPIAVHSPVFTNTDSVFPSGAEARQDEFDEAAVSLVPLLFFIVILYAAMSSGTTAIASAKEQGTFAGILMTPVKRSIIAFGHVTATWIKTLIPVAVLMIPLFIIGSYRPGALPVFVIMAALALFVSALTVMISTMSQSVVTAQTIFLPIFLVFIVLCVTCMQGEETFDRFYYMMPLYGQFLGTGSLLTGPSAADLVNGLVCVLITLVLAVICVYVTVRMLSLEKFTVSTVSSSDKDLRRSAALEERARRRASFSAKACVFGYKPRRFIPTGTFISGQLLRPLGLLAIFQMLALLPPLLLTGGSGLTDILMSLKDVNTMGDVAESSATIVGVFMSTPAFLISMAIGYILIIIVYVLHVRIVENRSLSTIGLPIEGRAVLHYLAGIPLGFGLMGLVFLLLIATGNIEIADTGIKSSDIPLLLAYFLMWFPQGATEEIMFRGYMMSRTAARFGIVPAVALSSLLFCLFHGLNPGFTVLALVNLVLISVLFALIALRTGRIWTLCAAHTMWNLTQGNILGLEVSGNSGGVSFITSRATADSAATDLWTGGSFGPEGGLAVTIVVVIAISVVLLVTGKKGGQINAPFRSRRITPQQFTSQQFTPQQLAPQQFTP